MLHRQFALFFGVTRWSTEMQTGTQKQVIWGLSILTMFFLGMSIFMATESGKYKRTVERLSLQLSLTLESSFNEHCEKQFTMHESRTQREIYYECKRLAKKRAREHVQALVNGEKGVRYIVEYP